MMPWNDGFRAEMAGIRDEILGELGADGLVLNQEIGAVLVLTTWANPRPDLGDPGTPTHAYLQPTPRAGVVLREQYRTVDGAARKVGDAKITVTRQVTEAQMQDGFWLIGAELINGVPVGGERYDLVQGYLKQKALAWEAVLMRRAAQADV